MTGDWGIRPNSRRKFLEKDVGDISACGWGIRPSPEEGLIKGKIWSWRHGRLRHARSVESTPIPFDADQTPKGSWNLNA